MPNWKKVIVSGSNASLNNITASADVNLSGNSLLDFNYSSQTVQGNVTASSAAHTIVVKVISKTSSHPYINLGSSNGYELDGIESPWLNLTEGIYKFDVSDSSVGSHPFRFYFDAGKTQQYTANVDTSESGAVYLTVNKDTPQVLYYQCSSHGYMGFGLSTGMNPLVQDQNGMKTLVSASAQITHDDTTGFVANEHIDHSNVTLTAGTGLTGGGNITANRSFAIDFSDSTFRTNISGSLSSTAIAALGANIVSGSGQILSGSNILSSSAQISDEISGSLGPNATLIRSLTAANISGSLSSTALANLGAGLVSASVLSSPSQGTIRLATNGVNTDVDSGLQAGDSPTFAGGTITGNLTVNGSLIAQEFKTEFISASIVFDSGSTIFGNSADDTHKFTGHITSSGNISSSGTIFADTFDGMFSGAVSSSAQLASDISGSFSKAHLASKVAGVLSSSAQIATQISGSVAEPSGNVSGSSTSTGSFGKLLGDGSQLTNLPSAAITSYTNTGDNRIITSVNATNVQGEANLTFDGSTLGLTGAMTSTGNISGSSTSTGSFGVINVGGGTFTSASLAEGGTGTGFPFSGSAVVTGSMFLSGSTSDTSIETLGNVSGSSTTTASFGRFEGDGSGLSNIAASIGVSDEGSSLTSAVSSINFVGDNVTATTSGNNVTVTLNNTNSTGDAKVINVSSAATTWAVTHSLSTKYPVVTIWDDNDQVIIPESITADTTNTATIKFEQAMSGRAAFTLGVPSGSYFISQSNQILTTVADSTIDGDLTVTGILTAQEFHSEFVSASVTFTSGSHKFGNSTDDTHEFTGSVNVTGSVTADTFSGVFSGAVSSSAQIADNISGSFTAASSSFSTRITTAETELSNTLVSSSAQISDEISGSLGPNASLIRSLTATTISGSFTAVSSSISTRLDNLANDIIALSIALG